MLAEEDIARLKKLLLSRQQELQGFDESSKETTRTVELDQTSVGRLSRMDAMQGQAMSLELKRRGQIQSQKIVSALSRIERGEYGYCLNCGEDIAVARLELDPATPLCIDCASREEAK